MKKTLVYCYLKLEKYFINICGFFKKRIKYDVAIVRLDAIGDYILFRNFLYELQNSIKYKNKTLLLVGNIEWKAITEELDRDIFVECVWINTKEIWINKIYRFKVFNSLSQYQFEDLIVSMYSRDLFCLDSISNIVKANNKIAFDGDCSNILEPYKNISDKFYTKLIHSSAQAKFEFERNKEFFEVLLNTSLNTKLYLPSLSLKNTYDLPTKYIVLFVGASTQSKRWPIEKFFQLGEWLYLEYGVSILFCGTKQDLNGTNIDLNKSNYFYNLIGKTNILELFNILSHAEFIVSNDTMVAHAGVAFNKHVFVLSVSIANNAIKRFTSYPATLTNKHQTIYHPQIYKNLSRYSNKNINELFNINEINVDLVKKVILNTIKIA